MERRRGQSEETVSRRREALQVALLLLALLTVFFWKAVFLGRKLLPVDIIYTDPIYLCHAPSDFTKPHNVLLYDQAYVFYPWRVYVSRALSQGFLPFWNPYVYCGTPFMAEDQPALFYPLNVLSYVLSPSNAALFTALARLFIAGLATYWFVRTIGGGRFGALVGAVTFAFSGFMIVWLGHPHTNVAAWLPAWFLVLEWLHAKNSVRHIALAALVMAAQLAGGHTETSLYTLTAGGLYYLSRLLASWWGDRRARPVLIGLLSFVAAGLLGLALASVHWLPFWEWLQHSAEYSARAGAENLQAIRPGLKYQLAGMLPMVLPNIFGNPTWPGEYKSFLPGWNFSEQTVYVGIVGLSLALFVAIVRRRDKRVLFLAVLGLVGFGAALRLPVFDEVNRLPLFNIASPGRFRLIYAFCGSVLAGLGAGELLAHIGKRAVSRPFVPLEIAHSASDGAGLFVGLLAGLAVIAVAALLAMRRVLVDLAAGSPSGVGQLSADSVAQAFAASNVRMYWPVLVTMVALVAFTLYLRRTLNRRVMQAILVLLVIVDLFAFGMDYHGTAREELVFPETPALRVLKEDQGIFRIVGTNIDAMPNTGIVHGLYDVRGLDFPRRRYMELCQAMGGRDWLGYGILFTERLQPRLLSLLNVKYILTTSRLGPKVLPYLRLLEVDRDVKVYENLSCLPRAFVVHRVRVSEAQERVLEILQDPEFDLASEIVLEKAPPGGFSAEPAGPPQSTAQITRYEPNRVTVAVDAGARGFLFLSDSYYPGWKAYVDGSEAEIYQADYAFRAVYLEPGQHTVEFVYEPGSFRVAAAISLLALIGTLGLLAGPWLGRLIRRGSHARRDWQSFTPGGGRNGR